MSSSLCNDAEPRRQAPVRPSENAAPKPTQGGHHYPIIFGNLAQTDVKAIDKTALDGSWIYALRKCLPRSVQEVVICLETYETKKYQLDYVVGKMREK